MTNRTSPSPPSATALADVLVERVEADVEVDGVDEAAFGGELDQLRPTPSAVIASGFSQTTCRPGGQDLLRLGDVEVVRRRDVDDVDASGRRAASSSDA